MLPIYVINMARHRERRLAIQAHLDRLGADYSIVEAVDGRSLSAEFLAQQVDAGPVPIPLGHVGCYLSHLKAYEALRASGQPAALVLEDDARIDGRVLGLLRQGLAPTAQLDYCFLDWEAFNRQGPVFYDTRSRFALGGGLKAVRLHAGPLAAHAYLITARAAALRLAHAFPIRAPIDTYENLPYALSFTAVVRPRLAWLSEFSLESTTFEQWARRPPKLTRWLKRSHLYYQLKDAVAMKWRAQRQALQQARDQGRLDAARAWAVLPSGKHILTRE